jgi:hypothetical protein
MGDLRLIEKEDMLVFPDAFAGELLLSMLRLCW